MRKQFEGTLNIHYKKKNLDDFNLFYTQPHDVKIFLFINVK